MCIVYSAICNGHISLDGIELIYNIVKLYNCVFGMFSCC